MPDQYDAQIYAPLCAEIRAVCKDKKMPRQEWCNRLYMLQPLTIKERGDVDDILNGITAFLDGGDRPANKTTDHYIDISFAVIRRASVDCVIEKAREIMKANPFSLEAVTNLLRIDRDGSQIWEAGVYPEDVWPTMYDIMPANIKLPDVPNLHYGFNMRKNDFSEPRTEKFLRLLNEESEEFIAKFILMTMAEPGGVCLGSVLGYKADDSAYDRSDALTIAYSTPEQLRRFPKWYQSWDRLVPTMCQRYQFYGDISGSPDFGGGTIQSACGDLSGSQYRLSREESRAMRIKDQRGEIDWTSY